MEENQYRYMFEVEDRHWWYAGNHEHFLQMVRKRGLLKTAARVLDAGCGTGRWLQRLKAAGEIVELGVDYSPLALELAAERGSLNLQQADLNTLELQDNAYDLITSFDVICNANIRDAQVVGRLRRFMKPGGYLLLSVPAYRFLMGEHDKRVYQDKRYTPASVRKLIRQNDLIVEHLTCGVCLLFPLALMKRLSEKVFKKKKAEHNEVKMPSKYINAFFLAIMRLENSLQSRISMPFGLSVIVLARKPL